MYFYKGNVGHPRSDSWKNKLCETCQERCTYPGIWVV